MGLLLCESDSNDLWWLARPCFICRYMILAAGILSYGLSYLGIVTPLATGTPKWLLWFVSKLSLWSKYCWDCDLLLFLLSRSGIDFTWPRTALEWNLVMGPWFLGWFNLSLNRFYSKNRVGSLGSLPGFSVFKTILAPWLTPPLRGVSRLLEFIFWTLTL